ASARTAPAHKPAAAKAAAHRHHATVCYHQAAHPERVTCRKTVLHRAADPVSGGQIVGLNADVAGYGGASTAARLSQVISTTGAKWLREEFSWATIEPQPGRFDFSYYDHFMLGPRRAASGSWRCSTTPRRGSAPATTRSRPIPRSSPATS